HGDARRKALDARTHAPALGDDARRSLAECMEERGGQRSARTLPVLQGMQGRLPRQCGRGDIQSEVSFALLGGSHAAVSCRLVWLDQEMGWGWELWAMGGKCNDTLARTRQANQENCGNRSTAHSAEICEQNILFCFSKERRRCQPKTGRYALAR